MVCGLVLLLLLLLLLLLPVVKQYCLSIKSPRHGRGGFAFDVDFKFQELSFADLFFRQISAIDFRSHCTTK